MARAKISLPVSALKQDDDALGLINFFATGNRPRPNANYRRSPSAMRTRQVQNALDILAELSLQLVSLSTLQQHSSGLVGGASTGAGIGAKVRRTWPRKEDARSMRPLRRLYV